MAEGSEGWRINSLLQIPEAPLWGLEERRLLVFEEQVWLSGSGQAQSGRVFTWADREGGS